MRFFTIIGHAIQTLKIRLRDIGVFQYFIYFQVSEEVIGLNNNRIIEQRVQQSHSSVITISLSDLPISRLVTEKIDYHPWFISPQLAGRERD